MLALFSSVMKSIGNPPDNFWSRVHPLDEPLYVEQFP